MEWRQGWHVEAPGEIHTVVAPSSAAYRLLAMKCHRCFSVARRRRREHYAHHPDSPSAASGFAPASSSSCTPRRLFRWTCVGGCVVGVGMQCVQCVRLCMGLTSHSADWRGRSGGCFAAAALLFVFACPQHSLLCEEGNSQTGWACVLERCEGYVVGAWEVAFAAFARTTHCCCTRRGTCCTRAPSPIDAGSCRGHSRLQVDSRTQRLRKGIHLAWPGPARGPRPVVGLRAHTRCMIATCGCFCGFIWSRDLLLWSALITKAALGKTTGRFPAHAAPHRAPRPAMKER